MEKLYSKSKSVLLGTSAPESAGRTRILVVDDSALMRKMLSEILSSAPELEVIGTARDGEEALEKAAALKPDVITLDVEMPRMNGIVCLEKLMAENPTRVVMVSSLTTEGAELTMACLLRGAIDFVPKPSGAISLNLTDSAQEIITKVQAAASARLRRPGTLPAEYRLRQMRKSAPLVEPPAPTGQRPAPEMHPVRARENAPLSKSTQPIDAQTIVVAIATSTGGPATLQELIPQLHTEPNAAYLLVQHMPPGFTQSLAERLNRTSRLAVREAKTGDSIERGLVLIAPGGHHLTVDAQGIVALNDEPPLWGVRPAADVLMHSVANHFGPRSLAVVLTGMGRDGALGAKAIVQAGGTCLAQDEATSVIYGMPRAALEVGAASQSVALGQMAAEIERHLAAQSAARGHRAA